MITQITAHKDVKTLSYLIESIIERKRLKPDEKATLLNDLTIRVHPYHPLKANGLGRVTFRPFDKLQRKFVYDTSCLADTAFYAAWLIFMKLYFAHPPVNWKGFMKSLHQSNVKERSHRIPADNRATPRQLLNSLHNTTLIECLKTAST